eukprot:scaffold397_cov152-Isochrysis_galbana.AAC.2
MTDPLTDSSLTVDRERSALGMSHADTHTPLHGPTEGVPSDKALSDLRSPISDLRQSSRILVDSCKQPETRRRIAHSPRASRLPPSGPRPSPVSRRCVAASLRRCPRAPAVD